MYSSPGHFDENGWKYDFSKKRKKWMKIGAYIHNSIVIHEIRLRITR